MSRSRPAVPSLLVAVAAFLAGCNRAADGAAKAPDATIGHPPAASHVVMETDQGTIEIELMPARVYSTETMEPL